MFKVGDKVKIVDSRYTEHYSRMTGGTGIVETVNEHSVYVRCDGDECNGGAFFLDEVAPLYEPVAESPASTRVIPDDDKRDNYPLFDVLFGYFPAAMCELARWSKVGNEQHNPGEDLHWSREKSTDHRNKIMRHLMDYDQRESNGFYEAVPMLWRCAALVQELLEKDGWPEGRNARRKE